VKSEGSAGDHPQPIVDSFDRSVRETEVDVGENTVTVLEDCTCDANEGTEPRAAGPREPFLQSFLCAPGLLVTEQVSESFLQEISPLEGAIRPLDLADLGPVIDREVPLGAQKREAGALDGSLLFGVLFDANQAAANLASGG
jgi:hypothetical protein